MRCHQLHAGIPNQGKSELCGRAAPSDDFCTLAQMISNPSHMCMMGIKLLDRPSEQSINTDVSLLRVPLVWWFFQEDQQ